MTTTITAKHCAARNCYAPIHGNGLCNTHYKRAKRAENTKTPRADYAAKCTNHYTATWTFPITQPTWPTIDLEDEARLKVARHIDRYRAILTQDLEAKADKTTGKVTVTAHIAFPFDITAHKALYEAFMEITQ